MKILNAFTSAHQYKKKYALLLLSSCFSILLFEVICKYTLESFFDKKLASVTENLQEGEPLENFMNKLGDASNLNVGSPKFPHPYFGYSRPLTKENQPLDSKVYGFVERPELWNLKKDSETLNIGIFGASVAAQAFAFEQQKNILAHKITNQLASKPTKKIRIFNFAYGAYKQPQQFIIASFYLDKLDVSINIDGANESSFLPSPYFPPHYPSPMISSLYFSQNLYEAKLLQLSLFTDYLAYSQLKNQLKKSRYDSSSFRTIIKARLFYLWKRIMRNLAHLNDSSLPNWPELSHEEMGPSNVRIWSKFLQQQNNLARSLGVVPIFILQPVPYRLKKTFSSEELELIEKTDKKRFAKLSSSYVLFSQESQRLKALGLPVYNFETIFDKTSETVFTDACCHLNEKGNTLLLENIAKIVQTELERQKSYR